MKKNVTDNLFNELRAMLVHAAGQGQAIPPTIVTFVHFFDEKLNRQSDGNEQPLEPEDLIRLSTYYNQMSQLIYPSKPNSVLLMQKHASGLFGFLGPILLVRQLTLLAMLFLISTVTLVLSKEVNHVTLNQGLLESSGGVLLLNLLFLLSCAGLGATFSCLHQLFRFINSNTYDPKFDASYWLKVIMGLMSGLMISELIPISTLEAGSSSSVQDLDKPLMALMGGFSSNIIYSVLSRLLVLVEQLFGASEYMPEQKQNSQENKQLSNNEFISFAEMDLEAELKIREDLEKLNSATKEQDSTLPEEQNKTTKPVAARPAKAAKPAELVS